MAKTYAGGTQVRRGYYIDANMAFENVDDDGATLPGGAESRWHRLPTLAVIAAAPALGGLFVVALPFIGFGVAAYALAKKIAGGAQVGAREVAATLAAPAVAPGTAHLTGHAPAEKDAEVAAPPAPDANTAELEREIEAQRGKLY